MFSRFFSFVLLVVFLIFILIFIIIPGTSLAQEQRRECPNGQRAVLSVSDDSFPDGLLITGALGGELCTGVYVVNVTAKYVRFRSNSGEINCSIVVKDVTCLHHHSPTSNSACISFENRVSAIRSSGVFIKGVTARIPSRPLSSPDATVLLIYSLVSFHAPFRFSVRGSAISVSAAHVEIYEPDGGNMNNRYLDLSVVLLNFSAPIEAGDGNPRGTFSKLAIFGSNPPHLPHVAITAVGTVQLRLVYFAGGIVTGSTTTAGSVASISFLHLSGLNISNLNINTSTSDIALYGLQIGGGIANQALRRLSVGGVISSIVVRSTGSGQILIQLLSFYTGNFSGVPIIAAGDSSTSIHDVDAVTGGSLSINVLHVGASVLLLDDIGFNFMGDIRRIRAIAGRAACVVTLATIGGKRAVDLRWVGNLPSSSPVGSQIHVREIACTGCFVVVSALMFSAPGMAQPTMSVSLYNAHVHVESSSGIYVLVSALYLGLEEMVASGIHLQNANVTVQSMRGCTIYCLAAVLSAQSIMLRPDVPAPDGSNRIVLGSQFLVVSPTLSVASVDAQAPLAIAILLVEGRLSNGNFMRLSSARMEVHNASGSLRHTAAIHAISILGDLVNFTRVDIIVSSSSSSSDRTTLSVGSVHGAYSIVISLLAIGGVLRGYPASFRPVGMKLRVDDSTLTIGLVANVSHHVRLSFVELDSGADHVDAIELWGNVHNITEIVGTHHTGVPVKFRFLRVSGVFTAVSDVDLDSNIASYAGCRTGHAYCNARVLEFWQHGDIELDMLWMADNTLEVGTFHAEGDTISVELLFFGLDRNSDVISSFLSASLDSNLINVGELVASFCTVRVAQDYNAMSFSGDLWIVKNVVHAGNVTAVISAEVSLLVCQLGTPSIGYLVISDNVVSSVNMEAQTNFIYGISLPGGANLQRSLRFINNVFRITAKGRLAYGFGGIYSQGTLFGSSLNSDITLRGNSVHLAFTPSQHAAQLLCAGLFLDVCASFSSISVQSSTLNCSDVASTTAASGNSSKKSSIGASYIMHVYATTLREIGQISIRQASSRLSITHNSVREAWGHVFWSVVGNYKIDIIVCEDCRVHLHLARLVGAGARVVASSVLVYMGPTTKMGSIFINSSSINASQVFLSAGVGADSPYAEAQAVALYLTESVYASGGSRSLFSITSVNHSAHVFAAAESGGEHIVMDIIMCSPLVGASLSMPLGRISVERCAAQLRVGGGVSASGQPNSGIRLHIASIFNDTLLAPLDQDGFFGLPVMSSIYVAHCTASLELAAPPVYYPHGVVSCSLVRVAGVEKATFIVVDGSSLFVEGGAGAEEELTRGFDFFAVFIESGAPRGVVIVVRSNFSLANIRFSQVAACYLVVGHTAVGATRIEHCRFNISNVRSVRSVHANNMTQKLGLVDGFAGTSPDLSIFSISDSILSGHDVGRENGAVSLFTLIRVNPPVASADDVPVVHISILRSDIIISGGTFCPPAPQAGCAVFVFGHIPASARVRPIVIFTGVRVISRHSAPASDRSGVISWILGADTTMSRSHGGGSFVFTNNSDNHHDMQLVFFSLVNMMADTAAADQDLLNSTLDFKCGNSWPRSAELNLQNELLQRRSSSSSLGTVISAQCRSMTTSRTVSQSASRSLSALSASRSGGSISLEESVSDRGNNSSSGSATWSAGTQEQTLSVHHDSISAQQTLTQAASPSRSAMRTGQSVSDSFSNLTLTQNETRSATVIPPPPTWKASGVPVQLASATMLLSALSRAPMAALTMQKLRALEKLSNCGLYADEEEADDKLPGSKAPAGLPPLAFDANPTGMSTGSSAVAEYVGSLLGNAIVICAFLLVQYLAAHVLVRTGRCVSLEAALANVHAPGLCGILLLILGVPSAGSIGASIAYAAVNTHEKIKAVSIMFQLALGILFFVIAPVYCFLWLAVQLNVGKVSVLEEVKLVKEKVPQSASWARKRWADAVHLFDLWFEGNPNWRTSFFMQRYGDVVDAVRLPWFVLFDYGVASMMALLGGISLSVLQKHVCFVSSVVCLVVALLHTYVIFIKKPTTAKFDGFFARVATVFTSIVALVAVLSSAGVNAFSLGGFIEYVSIAVLLGACVSFVSSVVPALKRISKMLKARRVISRAKQNSAAAKEKHKEKRSSSSSSSTPAAAYSRLEERLMMGGGGDDDDDDETMMMRSAGKEDVDDTVELIPVTRAKRAGAATGAAPAASSSQSPSSLLGSSPRSKPAVKRVVLSTTRKVVVTRKSGSDAAPTPLQSTGNRFVEI